MANVLIIDDDETMRSVLIALLSREGFRLFEAENGREGLDLCKEIDIDLVITDVLMPETDGIEVIMALKETAPDVKIIAISGGGRIGPEDYLPVATALGADRVFIKPFERREFIDAVTELLAAAENEKTPGQGEGGA